MSDYVYREHRAATPGAPLLFVFHGTGGDETQFFDFGRQALPQASIVSPRGDVSEHGALRFFRRTGEGVYDMEDLAQRTATMAAFVRERVADLQPSRVLGLGFSNGANILASVMLERGTLFDAAVLMHPLIPWEPAPRDDLAGRDVLITAGRRDPLCPPALSQALADYFGRQGSAVEMVWHDGGHEIRPVEVQAAVRFLTGVAG
ncbi:alpha/beta hydrolase [Mangrovibrevibacter kandeliae]|uniref:alpha/beta hydrolase n=1 Tax=Mangrovibrevibacter kandeliae TaxID=2968473 RepID=UPI002117D9E9|nr:alpha/beta hydrolase [Aurantimonas sp. CSK15Z-1]MCQ8780878.1 alpha/beta hydrolase [Aurantimonas sp. CSK15Z-1]